MPGTSRYLPVFKRGDYVDIVVDASIQKVTIFSCRFSDGEETAKHMFVVITPQWRFWSLEMIFVVIFCLPLATPNIQPKTTQIFGMGGVGFISVF